MEILFIYILKLLMLHSKVHNIYRGEQSMSVMLGEEKPRKGKRKSEKKLEMKKWEMDCTHMCHFVVWMCLKDC